jgi:thiamine-monophosphate kinase
VTDLSALGEFGLIERFTRLLSAHPDVVVGVGDDCAVLRCGGSHWLVSCDASLEGVHFRRESAAPEAIGWKAMASALSDIAAMGGKARFALVTLACPPDTDVAWLDALFQGLSAAAASCGAVIVGGDTTRSASGVVLDVTVIGEPLGGRWLTRAGARAGDAVAVTGYPGRSAAGLLALEYSHDAPVLIEAHLHPVPRFAEGQWLAEQTGAHALIDMSDGLLQDAGHVAEAAGLGLDIDPGRLPMARELEKARAWLPGDPAALILGGGEDYELIVALERDAAPALCAEFERRFGLPLTIVGTFEEAGGVRVGGRGYDAAGFDHFKG